MFTDLQAAGAWSPSQPTRHEVDAPREARALPCERRWRQPGQIAGTAAEDITMSRWICTQTGIRQDEATTPADRYFLAIALTTTRLKLSRGRHIIYDGIMPAGTLYVGAPSQQLRAQFCAPYDFLHFHPSASIYFPCARPGADFAASEFLNDLILLRDPFAEQLAKALTEHGQLADREFARCIGRTLAMHVARHERPHTKVNALAKWRLRRVEDYVGSHFERCISLSQLAKVAGLSRMHFAAQFRVATGYRPREYLLHERVEREITAVGLGDAAGRGGADRRLLHAGALLDRLQADDGRHARALAERHAERVSFVRCRRRRSSRRDARPVPRVGRGPLVNHAK